VQRQFGKLRGFEKNRETVGSAGRISNKKKHLEGREGLGRRGQNKSYIALPRPEEYAASKKGQDIGARKVRRVRKGKGNRRRL